MDFDEVIKTRRSIRKFKDIPISDLAIKDILDAGRLAPSVSNIQSTRFVIIRSDEMKKCLTQYTLPFVKTAAVIIVCCAYKGSWKTQEHKFLELDAVGAFKDIYEENKQQYITLIKEDQLKKRENEKLNKYYLWMHTAIAIDHMSLKVAELGLGCCCVGFVDREGLRKFLGLDCNYEIISLLPIGYPSYQPAPRPRSSLKDILLKEL